MDWHPMGNYNKKHFDELEQNWDMKRIQQNSHLRNQEKKKG